MPIAKIAGQVDFPPSWKNSNRVFENVQENENIFEIKPGPDVHGKYAGSSSVFCSKF